MLALVCEGNRSEGCFTLWRHRGLLGSFLLLALESLDAVFTQEPVTVARPAGRERQEVYCIQYEWDSSASTCASAFAWVCLLACLPACLAVCFESSCSASFFFFFFSFLLFFSEPFSSCPVLLCIGDEDEDEDDDDDDDDVVVVVVFFVVLAVRNLISLYLCWFWLPFPFSFCFVHFSVFARS